MIYDIFMDSYIGAYTIIKFVLSFSEFCLSKYVVFDYFIYFLN